jgi:hypothetical protein
VAADDNGGTPDGNLGITVACGQGMAVERAHGTALELPSASSATGSGAATGMYFGSHRFEFFVWLILRGRFCVPTPLVRRFKATLR